MGTVGMDVGSGSGQRYSSLTVLKTSDVAKETEIIGLEASLTAYQCFHNPTLTVVRGYFWCHFDKKKYSSVLGVHLHYVNSHTYCYARSKAASRRGKQWV